MTRIAEPEVAVSAVGDGLAMALKRTCPGTRHQSCVSQAFSQVLRYTTTRPRTQACAVPVAFGKRASAEFLHMSSALAYEGRPYVLAGTLGSPYRAFSATRMETVPQPGDYVVPDSKPSPDSDPGEG